MWSILRADLFASKSCTAFGCVFSGTMEEKYHLLLIIFSCVGGEFPWAREVCLLNTVLSGIQTGHLGILALGLKTQTRIWQFNFCGDSLQREDGVDRPLAAHSAVKTSSIFGMNRASYLWELSCLISLVLQVQTRSDCVTVPFCANILK